MDDEELEKLILNVKKSRPAKWTQNRVDKIRGRLRDFISLQPELYNNVGVLEALTILKEKQTEIDLSNATSSGESGGSGSGGSGESGGSGSGGSGSGAGGDGSGEPGGGGEPGSGDESGDLDDEEAKMAVQIPVPEKYKPGSDLDDFLESVETYFKVAGTKPESQKDFFTLLLGTSARKLKNATTTEKWEKMGYAEVKILAQKVLGQQIRESATVEFLSVVQGTNEQAENYASRVKTLAEKAGITDNSLLLNKIMMGLQQQTVRFEVLKAKPKTYEELLTEITYLTRIWKLSNNNSDVNNVRKDKEGKGKKKFSSKNDGKYNKKRDNNAGTSSDRNRKDVVCFHCRKPGHVKRDCYQLRDKKSANNVKQKQPTPPQPQQQQQQQKPLYNQLGALSLKRE